MKKVLLLFPLVIISCNKLQTESDKISIDKNWEIDGVNLNKSTIKDFKILVKQNISHSRKIRFKTIIQQMKL